MLTKHQSAPKDNGRAQSRRRLALAALFCAAVGAVVFFLLPWSIGPTKDSHAAVASPATHPKPTTGIPPDIESGNGTNAPSSPPSYERPTNGSAARPPALVPGQPDTSLIKPLAPPETSGNTERTMRMEQLQKELASEKNPSAAARIELTIAGYHVGDNNWAQAKDIYERLARNPPDPAVRTTAERNLAVVDKKLAVMAEPDPVRRDSLEMELGETQRTLGHENAARRIWQDVANRTTDAAIRQQAIKNFIDSVGYPPLLDSDSKKKETEK